MVAKRMYGRGTRYMLPFFVFYGDVDDVVKFGGSSGMPTVPRRPSIVGTFRAIHQLVAN